MWISRKRWEELRAEIVKIADSVGVLNEECGVIPLMQEDIRGLKGAATESKWFIRLLVAAGIVFIANVIQKGL